MIKAETLFNMLPALSKEEEERFFQMLGVVKAEPKKKVKRKIPTDQETTEYLIGKLFSESKRAKNKNN